MSGSGSKDSCGPCGPPRPGWPPAWLPADRPDPFGPTLDGGAGAGGGAGDERQADSGPTGSRSAPVAANTVDPDPVAEGELQEILRAIEVEVVRRTADERLHQAARNLLDDCRAALARGERDSAFASARHLTRSIPAYLSARGIP